MCKRHWALRFGPAVSIYVCTVTLLVVFVNIFLALSSVEVGGIDLYQGFLDFCPFRFHAFQLIIGVIFSIRVLCIYLLSVYSL